MESPEPPTPGARLRPNPRPAPAECGRPIQPATARPHVRRLCGDRAEYDVDERQQPVSDNVSDPGLVLGRRVAANKAYICYGLNAGSIQVVNRKTAAWTYVGGHVQRISDMALFSDDVNLLASLSMEGRISVWKISEATDEEYKSHINGEIIVSIQVVGFGELVHPRLCWHSHKQEILFIGIQNYLLKIDTSKARVGEISANELVECHPGKVIDGVQLVGNHEGPVTDLSVCQSMSGRLVSASADGTVIIWEESKAGPQVRLRPHDGQPVYSATFITPSHCPGHTVLISAGHLNGEVKLWSSSGEECLLPSDAESWVCNQTLKLKSSAECRPEDVFFNQVVVFPSASLILLANAKKNVVYAVHIEYGSSSAATSMDYLVEFPITMPALSLTEESVHITKILHAVQNYLLQTQAIQHFSLDFHKWFPALSELEVECTQNSISDIETRREYGLPPEMPSLDSFHRHEDDIVAFESHQAPLTLPLNDSRKKTVGKIKESFFNGITAATTPAEGSEINFFHMKNSQLLAMEDMLHQVVASQKELQKQISTLESSVIRANLMIDVMQEENAKQEKLNFYYLQAQVAGLITKFMTQDLPAVVEKTLKNELSSVVHTTTSELDKTLSPPFIDLLQRDIGDTEFQYSLGDELEFVRARQALTRMFPQLNVPGDPRAQVQRAQLFRMLDESYEKVLKKKNGVSIR